MKAILVVDVPMTKDNKHICNYCPIWNAKNMGCQYCENMFEKGCPLRPMPLKRETRVYWKSVGIGDIPTHEITDYDKGWNDCIDFLEGDMQDD